MLEKHMREVIDYSGVINLSSTGID